MSKCDKCGIEIVPENNNLVVVYGIVNALDQGFTSEKYTMQIVRSATLDRPARHFLPVCDATGGLICEGSPSRAQYIEGQPRDTRGFNGYEIELEPLYRKAYEIAKQLYA